jgi:hypothetical protein
MKEYIVPPTKSTQPCERFNEGKWERISFSEIKKDNLLRFYDRTYTLIKFNTPSHIVRAMKDAYKNPDGIYTVQLELDNIPNL